MKRLHPWQVLASGTALTASLAFGAMPDEGFARYEVILSRMPFGDAPAEPIIEEAPVPAAESFARSLRMCSITQPDGEAVKVGIVDAQTKKSFILSLGGEEADGITLVSANLEEEEAVLQKGTEIALVRLADGSATPLTQKQLAARKPAPVANTSYADRRRQRREDRLAQLAAAREEKIREPPRFQGEELRQHLQQYNMEVIRQGLPALPIELSPEQDAQLVAEGVLQPGPGSPAPPAPAFAPPAFTQADPGMESLVPTLPPNIGDIPVDQLTDEELILLEQLMNANP
jgi:hypothetical protein